MKNEYEVRGDVTAIFINSPKYGKQETLISTRNLERVKEFPNSWHVALDQKRNAFYVHGGTHKVKRKQFSVSLHRFLTDAPKGLVVDHIDHDGLNNTDNNLRVVTNAANGQNRSGPNKNNTSGVRGVKWHKGSGKWAAGIKINGQYKHVGYFTDLDNARDAVVEARMRHMPFSNECHMDL